MSRQNTYLKSADVVDATKKEMETQQNLARVTNVRDALDKELKTSEALKGLDDYRKMLAKPDLSDPTVLAKFELLTTGKRLKEVGKKPGQLGKDASYRNPPLLRLLDKAFFSPEGAFNLDFFKEMARHGFWPGATWSNPDSMHFELVEGRGSIKEPGMIRKGKLVSSKAH